jgi:hypothetical protein
MILLPIAVVTTIVTFVTFDSESSPTIAAVIDGRIDP